MSRQAASTSHFSPCLPWDSLYMPHFGQFRPPRVVGANSLGLVFGVGTAVTTPAKAVIRASPEKVRRRKFSFVCGFTTILMPIFFPYSVMSCRASESSVCSLWLSTTMVADLPSGSSRMPCASRLVRPISSKSLLASLGSYCAHLVAYSGLYSTDLDMIVLFYGVESPIKMTWFISSRSMASDSARRKRTSRNSLRHSLSLVLRLG